MPNWSSKEIERYCKLDDAMISYLENAVEKLALSARVYHRILKVARTIADLSRRRMILNKNI